MKKKYKYYQLLVRGEKYKGYLYRVIGHGAGILFVYYL